MSLKTYAKNALRAAAILAVAALSGCGADDIQLNGKIFDAMGVNSTGSVKKEVKVRERSPLVVPPGLDKLPEPGSQGAAMANGIAEVKDYDATRENSKADLERQQAAYCKVHYEQAKALGDQDADLATGPLGPCRSSVLSAIKKWNAPEEEEAE
ncbi:MAG: hypothetical protein IPL91_08590 [Hyphomicrobium sp.]|nr:hypothetical protein [Hyphomicrobium sp.]